MSRREEEARIKRVEQLEKEQVQVAQKLSDDSKNDHTKVEVTVAQIKAKTLEQEKEE